MEARPINNRRYLAVNADDFGYSAGVNRGILEAHQRGIVTSASLMVRQPAADEAIVAARRFPGLSLGLHLDLGEWAYRNGQWLEVYGVVALDNRAAVAREIRRQLELFLELTGRNPTHLDSHQHVHREEPVRSVLRELGQQLGVPVRHDSPQVHYCGAFYGQTATGEPLDEAISVESLIAVLRSLPAGFSELGCHPGFADDLKTMYARQRSMEVATLCAPDVRAALVEMGIELLSFHDLPAATDSEPGSTPHPGVFQREAFA
jgi:predicted glycoside hydrolase/deacetylase ChbG (UPF0249 family)